MTKKDDAVAVSWLFLSILSGIAIYFLTGGQGGFGGFFIDITIGIPVGLILALVTVALFQNSFSEEVVFDSEKKNSDAKREKVVLKCYGARKPSRIIVMIVFFAVATAICFASVTWANNLNLSDRSGVLVITALACMVEFLILGYVWYEFKFTIIGTTCPEAGRIEISKNGISLYDGAGSGEYKLDQLKSIELIMQEERYDMGGFFRTRTAARYIGFNTNDKRYLMGINTTREKLSALKSMLHFIGFSNVTRKGFTVLMYDEIYSKE